jgi:signal peptide peptidase SppA
MRNLAHLAARLYNAPLMLLPSVADTFAAVFAQSLDGRGLVQIDGARPDPEAYTGNVRPGSKFADKPYTVTDAGVALLPVYGALVQRAGQIGADCMPMASYQRLSARLQQMLADSDVKGVLMELDSPGGEVAGNFEFVRQLLALREGDKPIWGHANEGAYSAAYSIAAATSRITVPQAGSVGSIGVVMLHMDQSERDKKQGVTYTPIFAGARKVDFNSHAPLSKAALTAGQEEVNRLYDMFTGHVATARSIDQQAVRDTEAGIFAANDARQLGLVDAVANFDDTLAELTALVSAPQRTTFLPGASGAKPTAPTATKKGTAMSQTNADGTPVSEAEALRREQAAAATASTASTAAERSRISAILNHAEASGRTALARNLAFETDMSADAAGKILAAAGKDAPVAAAPAPAAAAPVSPLAAAMASVPNPAVAAAATADGDDTPEALAANVVALHRRTMQGAKA